jgi:DNA-binding IclR family transcriptional regulator
MEWVDLANVSGIGTAESQFHQMEFKDLKESSVKPLANPSLHASRQAEGAQNRSLERGIEILRAFRPGSDLLGNGEISDRTGIARATVSRLTQTLVMSGMLDYDRDARAYRLGVAVLSLALAMRSSNPVLQIASPLMRAASEKCGANVGLATVDRNEMVYLESFRYNRRGVLRTVVSGQRVPIELTSLGRAYLAAAPEDNRNEFLAKLRTRSATRSATLSGGLENEINEAVAHVREHGFCTASWQPEVISLASPVEITGYPIYVVNMSVTGKDTLESVVNELRSPLLALRAKIRDTALMQLQEF